ncbi:amino acid adenylation domain-containing protein [Archangium gephyra]|uniref:non-ribosomal peptide synthetase n=1 Tax=Archangium gephyra TaxID=48 RepID=UPI0035D42286
MPLSFAQQRLWFLEQLAPGSFAYNVPWFARLTGPLDVAALERSLLALVQRHEALRTTFPRVEGRPVQRTVPELGLTLPVESLEGVSGGERETAARRLAEEEARRPFDLEQGPLMRARLLRLSAEEHVLLLTLHHIVCDGWSMGLLERELGALYTAFSRGEAPSLPALPVQYADYAAWQREWLKGEVLEEQLAWWKRQLAGAPPVLELLADRPRPPVTSSRGALLSVGLPRGLSGAVREVSREEGVTPFMTLLAGFQALLARYSGQNDIVVGTPISGRNRREVEGLIGFFANTLALRVEAPGELSFRELLKRVREACLGAYAHQDVPFDRLVDALQPVRDLSRTPLFQASFVFQGAAPFAALELPGVAVEELVFEPGAARFDLTLFVRETEQGWVGLWEYNSELFDEATVARMAAHYARLLEGALAHPELALAELPLLSEAERRQVLVEWNQTRTEYPREACLEELFEAHVAARPEALAVEYEGERLTYAELNRRANQLARHLRRLGVGEGTRVGLCASRSLELVAAMLGILKAGGTYVPLDASYPRERLAFMVEDTALPVVLAQPELVSKLPPMSARVVPLEPRWEAFASERAENLGGRSRPEAMAYVMYTSGSTGRPKGVCIAHRAIVRLVCGTGYVRLTREERFAQVSNTSFDGSTFELWGALLNGGCVVGVAREVMLSPKALSSFMREQRISATFLTTALFNQTVAECPDAFQTLKYVLFGGEAADAKPPRRVLERGAPQHLVHVYGPTENTTFSTAYEVREVPEGAVTVPIGGPLTNSEAYVLDARMQPVPVGVAGELYVGGDGLALGYLNQPELTAGKFVAHPFHPEPGAKLYKTGDLARYLPDGNIEYLGRRDEQVKVRGFRIELGEVEAVLARHPAVGEVVVVARDAGPGGKQLVAYVVPTSLTSPPKPGELRTWLKQSLPEHMVPSAFVRLEALPLTPNGKVDRKALPAPEAEGTEREAYVAPRTPMEQVVADLWAPLLGLARVGACDHFFELGGHSLLATQVVSRLREVLQRELPVRVLFEAPTVEELARRLEASAEGRRAFRTPPLLPMPREGAPPLSFAQQRLWFLDQLEPDSPLYNVFLALRLEGALDTGVLERSFHALLQRHESLRTTFPQGEQGPYQAISAPVEPPLRVVELGGLPEGAREAEALRLAGEEVRRPFALAAGPLLRVTLLRLAEAEHVLVLVVHHIVSDGWSLEVLVRELKALYEAFLEGRDSPLAGLPVQYADYARWQREWLKGEVLEAQLAWWREQLRGASPALELPTDKPRPPVQSYRGAFHRLQLPLALTEGLRKLSQREGVTLFMTLLAGWQVLLHRYSGQEDVSVGSPIAGRGHAGLEGLIGFFVNTLVMRARVRGEEPFRVLLGRVREMALGAYEHQDVPFEMLVDELKPARDTSRAPLFQVAFALQNGAPPELALPGVKQRPVELHSQTAKNELLLALAETGEGLEGGLEYNTALFEASTIARMAGHLRTLLEGVVADAGQRVRELPLMDEAERAQVLVEWNGRRAGYPPNTCAHHLIEATAARTPDAVAVAFEDRQLTYRELNQRANQLAHHLRSLGVGPEAPVGVCLERSLEMVVGLLGVLKAGGAYVALDPSYPQERLAFMMDEVRMPVLVTSRALADGLPSRGERRVLLDAEAGVLALQPLDNPVTGVGVDNLAYVIFTSGSTGKPKGTLLTHRGLCNTALAAVDTRGLHPGSRVLQYGSLGFDASVADIFPTLVVGGCVVVAPRESLLPGAPLDALLKKQRVTLWAMTPSVLAQQEAGEYPALETVVSGGEACTPELVAKWRPGRRFINEYGPTEVTVFATSNADVDASRPALGRPLPNGRVYVLDRWLRPVPVGVTGELYVGGPGVARGYLEQPELTAERFLPDPFGGEPGARMYRTGDLGRWLSGGTLEFLGRSDSQVKLRGFRIELGEVEAALVGHAEVKEAVVVVREDVPGGKRLVAYVVPAFPTTGPGLNPEALRAWLKQRLPEYMVPSAFLCLESFPLTPSGKVDRQALPAPDLETVGTQYVAPRTALEEVVAGIWAPLLGLRRVGVHDNFFELGGHSLLATQVTSRLREVLKVELPVRALFEAPTVAELAGRLGAMSEGTQEFRPPPLVPVPREGELPLSFPQQRLWFLDQFNPQSALYNLPLVLRLEGELHVAALERAFQALVHRHEALRTTFRQGGQGVVQIISAPVELALPVVDLRELPEGMREEEARRLANEAVLGPFDLKAGPLLRVTLLRTGEAEHVLVLAMHHIVSDGWSMGVLARELTALYEAFLADRAPALEALPIQYADYAKWQQAWLRGEVLESKLAWWCEQLRGASPALELPTDRPRPAVQSNRGALHYLHLPLELAEGLRKLSQKEGVTLFMTLLAGFQALLHRYSGQDDISVGSSSAGRGHAGLEGLIGFFVNVLVLRARVRPEESFRQLLRQVREVALGAYAHEEVPFEKLVEALNPVRDTSRAPLFQVSFALQNALSPDLALPGIQARPLALTGQVSKYDLTLSLRETGTGLEGIVEYSTDLFDASTIARMLGHLRTLLEGVVADPGRRIGELPLLSEEERRLLLVEWNQTRTEYPRHATVHGLFEEHAARQPEAVAVEYEGQRLTYAELNVRANQVARALQRLDVGVGTLVGLCAGRSLELMAAMLGILKAGAAYVPLDPTYPPERLALMVEDSGVPVVLAQPEMAEVLPAGSAFVLELAWAEFAHESGENLGETVGPESLAYVMYTSGSTGKPKGVCIPHRGIVRLVRNTDFYEVTPEDRFTQLANTSFDSSNLELWSALLNGAALVGVPREVALSPKALAAFLREQRMSAMVFTTSLFHQVAAECPDAFQTMRYVMFGGEAADPVRLREVLRQGGTPKLLNMYGPTENTTVTTWEEVKEVPEGALSVPIGRPMSNTDVYVLDERMQPVPVGVPGELYTGGDGLALGYLKRPEATAEKFVSHPFSTEPGAKLYRTGDLVKYLPDGRLEFLGRRDGQVKVRGFRIELGEIEAALAGHPGISGNVVLARDDGPSGKWLVAYVVPTAGEGATGPGVQPDELRTWLKQTLPEHMVPSAFVFLEALPLTPNGKVDRKALPAPDSQRAVSGGSYTAPESGLEQSLAAIWAEVLRLERVGAEDNFFDLGGNSLLLQSVQVKVETLVGRKVPMVELFQFSTVRTLAAQLAGNAGPTGTEESSASGGNRREGMRQLARRRGRPGSN